MIAQPERYVQPFRDAGADLLTFHIEAVPQPQSLLTQIRELGAGAGISINPPTPVSALDGCLDWCDLVLVMSVMPGFGGQEFNGVAVDKLRELRRRVGRDVLLSVDGGINLQTVCPTAEAGADVFVAGTALFDQEDRGRFIAQMAGLAKSCRDAQV
jgi:ribulose-phosphate 3-epimerase